MTSQRAPTQRMQLHPLTPVADALPFVPVLVIVTFGINGGSLWGLQAAGIPVGLMLTVVFIAVFFLYRYLSWRRFTYWFDDSNDLRIDSGIFFRNERKVALSRLQAVDIQRPIIARLLGLSELRVEVAGAGDSRVRLAYLTEAEATRLRHEMVARAADLGANATAAANENDNVAESVIAVVPPGRLFASLLLRTSTAFLLAFSVFLIIYTELTEGVGGLALLLVTGGLPLFMVVTEFLNFYNFTVAKARDGVRLRYGLLRTQAQTVPHGRVAAFDVIEPLLWRWCGWVRIRITIAGVGDEDQNRASGTQTVLLPAAPREEAFAVLSHVLGGIEIDNVTLTAAPRRARWRAPIQWSRLAYGSNDYAFVTRRGLVTRHLAVVSHARTQSVSVVQGPYERLLGLSTLAIDVAPGPVKVAALYFPTAQVAQQSLAQVQRARVARLGDWASGPPKPPTPPTQGDI